MNWWNPLSWWQRPRAADGDTSGASNPRQWLVDWVRQSSDGQLSINGKTALHFAPIWYAVNKIGGHVGQLPLVMYRQLDETRKEPAKAHPAYRLMKDRPNHLMTAASFRETLMYHALIWGNGRAFIERDEIETPVSLIPLPPDRTMTMLVENEKWHVVQMPDGKKRRLPDEDVLHVPGLGYDGVCGYSLIELARQSWGLGMGVERHAAKSFQNQTAIGVVLEAPAGVLTDEQEATEFLARFNRWHAGLDNAGKTALLREGIKANRLSMPAKDAQLIETAIHQRQDAALWFLLETILGDDQSVSYNSLEQKNLAYLSNCLMRWLVKWEQECNEKLCSETQKKRGTHYFKFNVNALLRATTKERYDAYAVAISNRFMTPAQARLLEDWNADDAPNEYANPAITPGPVEPTPPDGTEAPVPTEVDSQVVDRLRARLAHLAEVERGKVLDGAGAKDFCGWLDTFYLRWPDTMLAAVQPLGVDGWPVYEFAAQSKALLLEVAGRCTAAELRNGLRAAMDGWPERTERLLLQCTGETSDA